MRKSEIQVGGEYTARVSGRFVTVRVLQTTESVSLSGKRRETYCVLNLATGRKLMFKSAAKFRAKLIQDLNKTGGQS